MFLKKYQPTNLDDFNISDFTKEIINKYIKSDKLFFIIHGNSISGKTSLINVILKEYYGELKNNNILFFNLLKENGINYYRNDLKTFCQINNVVSKNLKKTIIFDDIDLLNEQSQQIFSTLLNTYKNINYIFSCNDINKIENNLLRCLEYIKIDIINDNFLYKILNKIIINENIDLNEDIKKEIIKISNHSIPNIINILDKLYILNIYKKNKDNIYKLYYTSNILNCDFDNYINYCKEKNYTKSIELINYLYLNGYSVIDIIDEFFNYIKNFSNLNDEIKYKIIKLLSYNINIFNNLHEDKIELIFLTNNIIKILNN
jgi:DNA polymerase III delta prime subunit